MRKGLSLLASLLLAPAVTQAKDLGVQGTIFEIKEPSLLEVIQQKLKKLSPNQLAGHQHAIKEKAVSSIESPKAVAQIVPAEFNATRLYDPSLIVDEDIKDHQGTVIVKKGTHVNPLDYLSFGKPLVMIQGDDAAQVQWALKQQAKIVLVSGKPLQLARTHKQVFYFDQGGILCNKFSIKAVPTRISQKDKILLIEEFNLTGEK